MFYLYFLIGSYFAGTREFFFFWGADHNFPLLQWGLGLDGTWTGLVRWI